MSFSAPIFTSKSSGDSYERKDKSINRHFYDLLLLLLLPAANSPYSRRRNRPRHRFHSAFWAGPFFVSAWRARILAADYLSTTAVVPAVEMLAVAAAGGPFAAAAVAVARRDALGSVYCWLEVFPIDHDSTACHHSLPLSLLF